ncbi:hypothetical protein MSPP1_000700 [Malassezia sp. CBS 17886]|nr:hypothetical protein MSPP1_000700 [Malassezia sp. CBS 17886]
MWRWITAVLTLACVAAAHADTPPYARAWPSASVSHAGLYVNVVAPPSFHLYVDPDQLDVDTAAVSLGAVRHRTWTQVQRECRVRGGVQAPASAEACEHVDVTASERAAPVSTARIAQTDVHADMGVALDANPFDALLAAPAGLSTRVVTLTVVSQTGDARTFSWWLAHVRVSDADRARWPLSPSDVVSRDSAPPVAASRGPWTGTEALRLAGSLENPVIPASRSRVSRGISLRIRTDGDPILVHAPVEGNVVWSGPYVHRLPPFTGQDAGLNDEEDWCIMLADAWGFVFQVLGIAAADVRVRKGDVVRVGAVLGTAPSTPLSEFPESEAPPAEPLRRYRMEGFLPYPYRFRLLEMRVARAHASWTTYPAPDAPGWMYFHPLHLLTRGTRSEIPPFPEPLHILVAPRVGDIARQTPQARASLLQSPAPRAALHAELVAGFQSFFETPGDPADALDPQALYALDWAAEPERAAGDASADSTRAPDAARSLCGQRSRSPYWRRAFEHARRPDTWPPPLVELDEASPVFAHVVPRTAVAQVFGSLVPSMMRSQFDQKARMLMYAATRTHMGHPSARGAWNTSREFGWGSAAEPRGPTVFRVAVRARDVWGNTACLESHVTVGAAPHSAHAWAMHVYEVLRELPIGYLLQGIPYALLRSLGWLFERTIWTPA